ncbi:hypothetical protein FJZ18_01915 [Candidatus Pacearchaeota archaeon]|nr:hypothetical protein [Candidatus Pacearchaeota archaeon]
MLRRAVRELSRFVSDSEDSRYSSEEYSEGRGGELAVKTYRYILPGRRVEAVRSGEGKRDLSTEV